MAGEVAKLVFPHKVGPNGDGFHTGRTTKVMRNMEEDDILNQLSDSNFSRRAEILDQLRNAARKNGGRLPFQDQKAIFRGFAMALADNDWDVRHHCIQLVHELIPHLVEDLDECMALILPRLVPNMGDGKITIRRAVIQTLHVYMKHTYDMQQTFKAIVQYGLDNPQSRVRKEVIIALPMMFTPEFSDEDFFDIAQSLAKKLLDTSDDSIQQHALLSLEKIRNLVGDKNFGTYMQRLSPPLRKYYTKLTGRTEGDVPYSTSSSNTRNDVSTFNPGDSVAFTTSVDNYTGNDAATQGTRIHIPSSGGKLEFGVIPSHIMERLKESNFRARAQAVEELKVVLKEMSDTNVQRMSPHVLHFIAFLTSLLDDSNFKITTVTLEILGLLVKRQGPSITAHLKALVGALSKRMGDNKIVIRQAIMKVIMQLMQVLSPKHVLSVICENLSNRNSRVRQETLNIVIASLLTFPSYDFDLAELCDIVAPTLIDPKRQVRQAALECYAAIASNLGPGKLQPLVSSVDSVELSYEGDGVMAAVQARLARRILPKLNADGLVDYATPVPSSAGSRSSSVNLPPGADIEWILSASGGTNGSARSNRSDIEIESVTSSARTTPAPPPLGESPSYGPTPRRSAGKGKGRLPWEETEVTSYENGYSNQPNNKLPRQKQLANSSSNSRDQSPDTGSYRQMYLQQKHKKQTSEPPANQPFSVYNSSRDDESHSAFSTPRNNDDSSRMTFSSNSWPDDPGKSNKRLLEPITDNENDQDSDHSPIPMKPALARGTSSRSSSKRKVPPIPVSEKKTERQDSSDSARDSVLGDFSDDTNRDEMQQSLRQIRNSATRKKVDKIFEVLDHQHKKMQVSRSPSPPDSFPESGIYSNASTMRSNLDEPDHSNPTPVKKGSNSIKHKIDFPLKPRVHCAKSHGVVRKNKNSRKANKNLSKHGTVSESGLLLHENWNNDEIVTEAKDFDINQVRDNMAVTEQNFQKVNLSSEAYVTTEETASSLELPTKSYCLTEEAPNTGTKCRLPELPRLPTQMQQNSISKVASLPDASAEVNYDRWRNKTFVNNCKKKILSVNDRCGDSAQEKNIKFTSHVADTVDLSPEKETRDHLASNGQEVQKKMTDLEKPSGKGSMDKYLVDYCSCKIGIPIQFSSNDPYSPQSRRLRVISYLKMSPKLPRYMEIYRKYQVGNVNICIWRRQISDCLAAELLEDKTVRHRVVKHQRSVRKVASEDVLKQTSTYEDVKQDHVDAVRSNEGNNGNISRYLSPLKNHNSNCSPKYKESLPYSLKSCKSNILPSQNRLNDKRYSAECSSDSVNQKWQHHLTSVPECFRKKPVPAIVPKQNKESWESMFDDYMSRGERELSKEDHNSSVFTRASDVSLKDTVGFVGDKDDCHTKFTSDARKMREFDVELRSMKKAENPFESKPRLARKPSQKSDREVLKPTKDSKSNTNLASSSVAQIDFSPHGGVTFKENPGVSLQMVGMGIEHDNQPAKPKQMNYAVKARERRRVNKDAKSSSSSTSTTPSTSSLRVPTSSTSSLQSVHSSSSKPEDGSNTSPVDHVVVGHGMFDGPVMPSEQAVGTPPDRREKRVSHVKPPVHEPEPQQILGAVYGVGVRQNSLDKDDGEDDDDDVNSIAISQATRANMQLKVQQKKEEAERQRQEKERLRLRELEEKRRKQEAEIQREKERQQLRLRRLSDQADVDVSGLAVSGSGSQQTLNGQGPVTYSNPAPKPPTTKPANTTVNKRKVKPVLEEKTPSIGSAKSSSEPESPDQLKPFRETHKVLDDALRGLGQDEWDVKCSAINSIRRLAAHHPEVLCTSQLHTVNLALISEVKNLRSQVSRLAIICLGEMFQKLKKHMEPDLDQVAGVVLTKAGESNNFIRDDMDKALSYMIDSITPQRAMLALIVAGASHRNAAVRKTTSYFLIPVVEKLGPGRLLSGIKDVTDRILPVAANFIMDGNPETRYNGAKIFHILMSHEDFDRVLSKHLPQTTQRNINDKLETLKRKGLGEPPTENGSAKNRRSGHGSRISSSVRYNSASTSGTDSTPTSSKHRSALPRTDEATMEEIKSYCSLMTANDWRERQNGITRMQEMISRNPTLAGSNIVKVFDKFVPCLKDSNSKVNLFALHTMEEITKPLAEYIGPVINYTIQTVASNLSSKNKDIYEAACSVLDGFMNTLDETILLQPFANQAQNGNSRIKPDMVDRVAYLVNCVYPVRPRQVVLHVLPLLWHLLGAVSQSGATPGGTGNIRVSTNHLVHALLSQMGDSLMEHVKGNSSITPRMTQCLQEMMDNPTLDD